MSLDTSLHEPKIEPDAESNCAKHLFTEAELRGIVEKASTLRERMQAPFSPVEGTAPDERRLARWCKSVARGDWELFRKRLRWSGWTLDQARDALRPVRLPRSVPLPDWTDTLTQCAEAIATGADTSEVPFLDDTAPLPFEHLLAPVVHLAQWRVHEQLDGAAIPITEAARADLARLLLRQVSALSAQTLNVEFSVFKATSSVRSESQSRPDATYRAFLAHMRNDDIGSFFQRYSVLARKLAGCVDNWVTNTVRFLTRLHEDWATLRRTFSSDADPGSVCHIKSGVSDPHGGRQQAHIVECETGLRFVYKPKSLDLAVAFQRLVRWSNTQGMTPALYAMDIVDRPSYGWVEYINPAPCHDQNGPSNYFQRAGGLLALAYVLNAKDLHHGNLIAQGEHPILIDLETLVVPPVIYPQMENQGGDTGDEQEDKQEENSSEDASRGRDRTATIDLEDSVLGTLLLPRFLPTSGASSAGARRNISGLSGETQQTAVSTTHWQDVNTDQMRVTTLRKDVTFRDNVPHRGEESLHSSDFAEEIQNGFERMYRLIQAHRDDWTEEGGVLSWFAESSVRSVFRPTIVYGRLRRALRHPSLLSDGLDPSIALDVLVKSCLPLSSAPPIWPVIQSEKQSLHGGDVPLFKAPATSTSVQNSDEQELGIVFSESGVEQVMSRVQSLSDDNLALQKDLIWASLQTQRAENVDTRRSLQLDDASTGSAHALTETDVRDGARQIMNRLRQTTLPEQHDGVSWIVIGDTDPRIQQDEVQKIGQDIHSGRSGIGLFLGACSHLSETGGQAERDLTLKTFRPLLDRLRKAAASPDEVRSHAIGGTYGLGAYVYALTCVGALINEDALIDGARIAASLISERHITEDSNFDLFFGTAGATLGLLTLYRHTGDEAVLAQAEQCGQHLLHHRTAAPTSSCRAWRTLNNRFMTGLSHGASGIAHALTELHKATGTSSYLDAALEAFDFERSLFLPDAQNWLPSPSYRERDVDPDTLWSTWCRGATGMGLARLANLDLFSDAERAEVEDAIATTQTHLLRGVDHLCCGVMGRVEFLLMAAETLDRPDLAQTARRAAGSVLVRAQNNGTYTLTSSGPDKLRPGFFQGLSGIGYQLLRLVDRDALPSVLLLR
jgi:type 2 lantibiotic biosynthesis protein LanM